ncbi:hypothetical protein HT031_001003 [Scenedesmus sp. PABB004]|nr:hypothetical protein HT031_001003 [Scenedesmus sp. PABB004]
MPPPRELLLAVDDTPQSQVMFDWVLDNELQPGDRVHLLHVTLRIASAPRGDLPRGDYFEQAHPVEAQRVATEMLAQRFLAALHALGITPQVHLVQASLDAKTVGRLVCSKAAELGAAHVFVGAQHHQRSRLASLLGGMSVADYCKAHCTVPLTVVAQAGTVVHAAPAGAAVPAEAAAQRRTQPPPPRLRRRAADAGQLRPGGCTAAVASQLDLGNRRLCRGLASRGRGARPDSGSSSSSAMLRPLPAPGRRAAGALPVRGSASTSRVTPCRLCPARAAAGAGQPEQERSQSELPPAQAQQLRGAVIALAATVAFASHAGAARAEAEHWVPRRHHRHIGERFTDTWADSIVEVEHATASRVRELERQLEAEKKRADSESGRRREAEQKLKLMSLQQSSQRRYDDDALLSIRVGGADFTGPLAFGLIFAGVWAGWQRSKAAGGRAAKGRWVYDRSMGGKKVWVAYDTGELPEQLSDAAFDELTSKAAAKAAAARKAAAPYQPPDWWQPPMSFAADDAARAAAQLQASSQLARIEQAKNRGQDYRLADIAALRRTCQAGGGVTVDARTVGGRDAIFKAAVDGAVRRCLEPSSVDVSELADSSPLGFVAGVAQDLQIPDERAIGMASNWVAGHCRARVIEAYTAAKKGDDVAAATALAALSSLLGGMPLLSPGSSQVDLIAEELAGWAEPDVLARLGDTARTLVEPEQQAVVAAMLGA